MEEKQPIKINLSTCLLIIALILIIIMGYYIYCISKEKSNAEKQVKDLTSQTETKSNSVVDNKQSTNSTPSAAINSNSENVQKTTINNTAIKSAIQKYFDIKQTLSSDTLNLLVEIGLKSELPNRDNYNGFKDNKPYENSYFYITDIKFTDFENALSKYMTLDLFNSQYPNYVRNNNGMLCIYSEGGSTGNMTIKNIDISNSNSGAYTCNVIITKTSDDDGKSIEEKYVVTVIEKNGNYVVSDCRIK